MLQFSGVKKEQFAPVHMELAGEHGEPVEAAEAISLTDNDRFLMQSCASKNKSHMKRVLEKVHSREFAELHCKPATVQLGSAITRQQWTHKPKSMILSKARDL